MSCFQMVIPSETSFDGMMRKHILKQISSHSQKFGADWEDWVPTKPLVVAENVLLDDKFLSEMRPSLGKQLTTEQIENLRGKTASRILVAREEMEFSITLEF